MFVYIGKTNIPNAQIEDFTDIESVIMCRDRLQKCYSEAAILDSLRTKARDNARTPMQWNDGLNAGFTEGKGMAVIPSEGRVVAPCEAEVSSVFDTKHAVGLSTKDGIELLIHVGVNTVELGGKYYEAHVSQGDKVKPGQLLLTFDIEKIQEAGYNVTTPVIIANTDDYKGVTGLRTGSIQSLEPLIKVEEE